MPALTRRPLQRLAVVISCEHGGNTIPAQYRRFFRGATKVLNSHRGWDAGALVLARDLCAVLKCPLIASQTSRLLVDLNRSPHHRHVFSGYTRHCNSEIKQDILQHHYYPYRANVEAVIRRLIQRQGFVLHLSVHSFTPELKGIVRNADIGLLYDPARRNESAFASRMQLSLRDRWRVRRNYPYRGTADGLTVWLRACFSNAHYAGIEIEVNQGIVTRGRAWAGLRTNIIETVRELTR